MAFARRSAGSRPKAKCSPAKSTPKQAAVSTSHLGGTDAEFYEMLLEDLQNDARLIAPT